MWCHGLGVLYFWILVSLLFDWCGVVEFPFPDLSPVCPCVCATSTSWGVNYDVSQLSLCSETSISDDVHCLCFSHIKSRLALIPLLQKTDHLSIDCFIRRSSEEQLRWAWSLKAPLVLHTVHCYSFNSCHLEVLCIVRWREHNVLQTRTCVQHTLPWWFKEPHVPDTTLLSNTGWRLRCLSCFPIPTTCSTSAVFTCLSCCCFCSAGFSFSQ